MEKESGLAHAKRGNVTIESMEYKLPTDVSEFVIRPEPLGLWDLWIDSMPTLTFPTPKMQQKPWMNRILAILFGTGRRTPCATRPERLGADWDRVRYWSPGSFEFCRTGSVHAIRKDRACHWPLKKNRPRGAGSCQGLAGFFKSLIDIFQDIVNMFYPDRQPYQIITHTGNGLFFLGQLPMCGGSRLTGQ